jgi:hypothetical protein
MSTKKFLFGGGVTGVTGATGVSNVVSAPNPYKVVEAHLLSGTAATVLVYGSINGGVTHHLIDTLTLTGALGEDAYEGTNAYDSIDLSITALTGTVGASIRYAHN